MSSYTKGLLLALSGVFIMSFEAPLIKLSKLPVSSIGFYFGLTIFLTTQILLLLNGMENYKRAFKVEFKGVLLSGIFMGVGNYCFISAVSYAGIANTVLILASAPIVSALIALWLLNSPTPKEIYIAAVVVFIGIYIIFSNQLGSLNLKGNLFAVVALFLMSGLFIILTKYQKANRVAFVSIGGLIIMLISLPSIDLNVNFSGIFWILIMGVIVTPFSRILIGKGTYFLIPAEMGLLMILETVLAPFWGWWWLNEVPTSSTAIGGGVILLAIFWNAWMQLKKKNHY